MPSDLWTAIYYRACQDLPPMLAMQAADRAVASLTYPHMSLYRQHLWRATRDLLAGLSDPADALAVARAPEIHMVAQAQLAAHFGRLLLGHTSLHLS
jgi:hypothetical protein